MLLVSPSALGILLENGRPPFSCLLRYVFGYLYELNSSGRGMTKK